MLKVVTGSEELATIVNARTVNFRDNEWATDANPVNKSGAFFARS